MSKASPKVLVVGLDGATLDLLGPLMEEGRMPFLRDLASQGVLGKLETTYPPVTAPAWASFMTGKNPGKHGVYEFLYRRRDGFDQTPVNSRTLGSRTLWDLLGAAGLGVGLINVPLTYPPTPLNGFVIGDFLTPAGQRDFAYPAELVDEIEDRFGSYPLYHTQVYTKGSVGRVIDEVNEILRYRGRTARYLMESRDWDFFMVHIDGTDRIQHELWHILDPEHPQHDPKEALRYREPALKFFEAVDREVRRLVAAAGPDATKIVMSDHGFGPIHRFVNFNVWLLREGFLELRRDPATLVQRAIFRFGLTPALAYRMAMNLGLARLRLSQGVSSRFVLLQLLNRALLSLGNVDWAHSRAYSRGNYGQLYVNLRGREPAGAVNEGAEYDRVRAKLVERLIQLRDPDTGAKVVQRVFLREDLYHGPHVDRAPDVCFLLRPGYKALGTLEFTSNRLVEPVFGNSGDHRMEGFVTMTGPGVRAGHQLEGAQIIDMAPTILYLLGCAIPDDVDGSVLMQAFRPEHAAMNHVRYADSSSQREASDSGYSEEQAEEIKSRLKGLGYWG